MKIKTNHIINRYLFIILIINSIFIFFNLKTMLLLKSLTSPFIYISFIINTYIFVFIIMYYLLKDKNVKNN